jgi:putative transposase
MSNQYASPKPAQSKKFPNHPAQKKQAPPPLFVLSTGLSLKALFEKFMSLFPKDSLALWLGDKVFYNRAFTPLITLWYMVFQHLSGDSTLEGVIEDALDGGADRLSPKGKRLSKVLRSHSTSSWANARQRLPVSAVHQALRASGQAIGSTAQNRQWHGMDPTLLDGTTYRLRPLGDIPEEFPAHRSGNNSQPYWCLARAVVAFCMATGGVLHCVIGPIKLSEQALVLQMLMLCPWVNALFVADRNFGVYSVVRAAVAANANVLFRLTDVRAKKLAREANVRLEEGLDQVIQWKPTRHDKCPEKLSKDPVKGRLIAIRVNPRGFRSFTLYLFTTLVDPQITGEELAQFYGQRWQVELNLRYVKTQLNLNSLECKSADMARKLWLAGLMAYNLVRAVMCAAAASANKSVLSLSFSRSLKALRKWLPKAGGKSAFKSWKRLLGRIARFTLPKRKKPRPSEPRAMRYFKSDFPKLSGNRAKAREKLALASAKS